jgi:pyruvate/2-oxoglutarate dehydrogenase complex dihydrolipoamide dehydrogenase (E3) component
MDQILGPEDSDVAEILRGRLEAEGVKILSGTKAIKAESNGLGVRLTVVPATGEGKTSVLEAEALLVATGRKPNIADLGLEAPGVEYSPRGITTDARMRTNIRHIYACGDVNGQLPFTHVAGYEASTALTNIVLRIPRKADYSKVAWCTYTDPEVASIGLNEKRAQADNIEYKVLEESFGDNDRALAEGEELGKIKVLINPKGKLLGCQIIGPHAGELIHEWVTATWGGVKLSTLAGAIHVYPTLSEISKRAAGAYFAEKLFSERTKSVLRLLFHLKGRACTLPEERD